MYFEDHCTGCAKVDFSMHPFISKQSIGDMGQAMYS